ncbi:heterokaryon incompatibility protein-domain-containing protein, partial [Fusarium tricinctum]
MGEIRFLSLMPDEEAHWLRCRLTHVHLHVQKYRPASFKALSYCWGREDPEYPIVIFHESKCEEPMHGRRLSISENLYQALKQLRSESEDVVIWADQVCINQNDDDEKTSQVMVMRDVYQTASSTLIWLGPAADNSDEALSLIPKLLPAPYYQVWYDLFTVLKRDWFYRVWITQEVAVSPHATVLCGDMEF